MDEVAGGDDSGLMMTGASLSLPQISPSATSINSRVSSILASITSLIPIPICSRVMENDTLFLISCFCMILSFTIFHLIRLRHRIHGIISSSASKQKSNLNVSSPSLQSKLSLSSITFESKVMSSKEAFLRLTKKLKKVKNGFFDYIVVGAGTAGTSFSFLMAQKGKKVLLIEKDWAETDRIVGELMQPGGMRALEKMGLDDCIKNGADAVPSFGYMLIKLRENAVQDGDGGGCAAGGTVGAIMSEAEEMRSRKLITLLYPKAVPGNSWEQFGFLSSSKNPWLSPPPSSVSTTMNDREENTGDRGRKADKNEQEIDDVNDMFCCGNVEKIALNDVAVNRLSSQSVTQNVFPRAYGIDNAKFVTQLRKRCIDHPNILCLKGCAKKLIKDEEELDDIYNSDGVHSDDHSKEDTSKSSESVSFKGIEIEFPEAEQLENELLMMSESPPSTNASSPQSVSTRSSTPLSSSSSSPLASPTLSPTSSPVSPTSSTKSSTSSSRLLKIPSKLVVLCDGGMAPNLRLQQQDFEKKDVQKCLLSTWVGLLLNHEPYKPPVPQPGLACVVLVDPSPVLIYQRDPCETRVLVCVDGDVNDHRRYIEQVVIPQMPFETREVMRAALNEGDRCASGSCSSVDGSGGEGAASSTSKVESGGAHTKDGKGQKSRKGLLQIKNAYSMLPTSPRVGGVLCVGDSCNLRHALTGCGMTVVLNDVLMLSGLLENEDESDHERVKQVYDEFLAMRRDHHAGVLNTLANALHQVLVTPMGKTKQSRVFLQEACFDYLSNNDFRSAGPIALLSGLTSAPWILSLHFFLVTLFAMRKVVAMMRIQSVLADLKNVYSVLHEGVKIIIPLLIREKITVLSSWPVYSTLRLIFPF